MADKWTHDEEQEFVELLDGYIMKEGLSLNKSFDRISVDIGRTPSSLMFRWQKFIRGHIEGTDLLNRIHGIHKV